jgi:hypothetical protein
MGSPFGMICPTMGTTESTSLWEVGVRGVEKPLRAVSGLAWAEIGCHMLRDMLRDSLLPGQCFCKNQY